MASSFNVATCAMYFSFFIKKFPPPLHESSFKGTICFFISIGPPFIILTPFYPINIISLLDKCLGIFIIFVGYSIKWTTRLNIIPNSLMIKLDIHDPASPKMFLGSIIEITPQPGSSGLKVNKDKKMAVDTKKRSIIILFLNIRSKNLFSNISFLFYSLIKRN